MIKSTGHETPGREGDVDERGQVLVATVLGAVMGGVFATLYLTERGRRVRGQIEPWLDAVIDELERTRHTVEKARAAGAEGRRTLDDLLRKEPRAASAWEPREAVSRPSS